MSRVAWETLETLFGRACTLPPEERARFLAEECADLDDVRRELESLLSVRGAARDFFDRVPATDLAPDAHPAEPAVERVGPYRILATLGEGGMARVYLAERHVLGAVQRVALKLVRPSFLDGRREDRFRLESRILARLDHPGIARFIDAGVTEAGQPYCAMEHVRGRPLLAYCDEHRLGVDARLRLFLQACDAVHYAHQQLVVHRDLKPAHVLVTPSGQVKLLDFGVARLLDPAEESDGRTTTWALTPAYASPEQLRGDRARTPSDVYALGLLLYELLCGRRPRDVAGRSLAEIERIVCRAEPPRPSEALDRPPDSRVERDQDPSPRALARRRGDTPRGLRRRLRDDLDNIVLRALAVEPRRRYGSADRLAQDIRDHLAGRPVTARPHDWRYRVSKFVKRHRAPVAAAAAVAAALVAGTAVATWQAAAAGRARDQAEVALQRSEEVRELLVGLLDADGALSGRRIELPSLEPILARGVVQARAIEGDPLLRAEVLHALGRAYMGYRDYPRAEPLLREAVALRREAHPDGHVDLARSLSHLGVVLYRRGRIHIAAELLREALEMKERELGPNDPLLAETLVSLGYAYRRMDRPADAVAGLRRAVAIRRDRLPPDDPLIANGLHELAVILWQTGRLEEAEDAFRRAIDQRRRTHDRELGEEIAYLGDVVAERGRPAEAEALYREALALQERAFGEDSHRLMHPLHSLGSLLAERGAFAEAEGLLRRSVALQRRTWGPRHVNTIHSEELLAGFLHRTGRHAEAAAIYRRAVEVKRQGGGGEHPGVANSLFNLARELREQGLTKAAETALEESLEVRRRVDAGNPVSLATALCEAARVFRPLGEASRAAALLREAARLVEGATGPHAEAASRKIARELAGWS